MSDLSDAVAKATGEHALALRWFRDNADRTVSWAEMQAHADQGARLVNQAKGIYKPHHVEYALSVRQTLESPYADKRCSGVRTAVGSIPIFRRIATPRSVTTRPQIVAWLNA
jgi:hypothetical protein